jgi:acyl dehydratase
VHATHDLTVHRLVRPGDRLSTTLEVIGVEKRAPGAFTTARLTTVDADGRPVATTEQGSLYLGVDTDGLDVVPATSAPPLDTSVRGDPVADVAVPGAPGGAHTYTECARIWNPIHSDAAVAAAAGLPAIILHGTATLAHGVSAVVARAAGGEPSAVRRIVGRFSAMVLMPSTIVVRLFAEVGVGDGTTAVPFEVLTEGGAPAVSRAAVVLG